MPAITPTFLMDLESRMEVLTESEYARLTANLWWQLITRTRTTTGRRDVVAWLLSTAQIKSQGKGGNIAFDDLVSAYTELEVLAAGNGLRLNRFQLEDTDGGGVDLAAQWSADTGAYMAYWPQKLVADFLKNAHTSTYTAYDKLPFFANNHPHNPYQPSLGTYSNLMTGVPIDDSVSLDQALINLGKVYANIAAFKMPNGVDPRFLRPKGLLVNPRMFPRVSQLTGARFLAQAAAGGAGSSDVEPFIKALGFSLPVQADELSGFESNTTYYVACEQLSSSRLGAVLYTQREAFHINYYGVQQQAELDRRDELEWHNKGRNAISAGHPYLLIKCTA